MRLVLAAMLPAAVLLSALVPPAAARDVLPRVPKKGALRHGEVIYAESRRCGPGQVLRVTGGVMPGRSARRASSARVPRQYACVPR